MEPRDDDAPGEADLRPHLREMLSALKETKLDEAIRPKFLDAVEGKITWEAFEAYLEVLAKKRRPGPAGG